MSKNSKERLGFPSSAESNQVKDSVEYGMQVARAIEQEWFEKDGNSGRYFSSRQRFHSLRLYAQGDQDIRKYKDEFTLNGDLSYLNLDWTPVPIIPKFHDIVVNGMANRQYVIEAKAVDVVSTAERERFVNRIRKEMENRQLLQTVSAMSGVNVFENRVEDLPGSDDELQLYLSMNYKQAVEVAIEAAIDYEMKINRYKDIKHRIDQDLVTIGIGACKHTFNPTEGIKLEYVDPANLVYSHTKSQYFDDCFYFGEVKRVNILEIQKMFPNLTSEDIEAIRKKGNRATDLNDDLNTYYDSSNLESDQEVDILYFCYKTVNNEIYKIRESNIGGLKAIERDETFEPPKDKRSGYEKTHRANEVIYEGVKIIGADVLIKWELAKNMVRKNDITPKVVMPYVVASPKMYNGKVNSLVKRMEKYADAIQIIHLKIQQIIQRMTPSGVFIDVDGLAEVDLGNGTTYNPQEALNMYMQTGSVVGRSMTQDGEFNNARVPIQELPGSDGRQLQSLLAAYEYNLSQIRNVTGLNEARDGSTPDPKALVGVQRLAAANSNTATRHVLDASTYITTNIADGVALRIQDVLEYSPARKDFIQALGQHKVGIMEDLKDIHHNEFGIFIELGPDEEEKQMLEQNIQQALAKDAITVEDAIDVRRVNNYKLAFQLLKLRREQRDAKRQQEAQANIKAQAEANAQSAQAAEMAKAQAAKIEMESKAQLEQLKAKLETEKLQQDAEIKKQLMDHEHQLGLKTLQAQNSYTQQMNAENNQTSLQKEKMKTKVNTPFESRGNDTVGNIDNGVFEPK